MTLQRASLLLVCSYLATLISATKPARLHEARQGPISIEPLSGGPGPESVRTSSTTHATTTMPATPSSKPSSSSSSASTNSHLHLPSSASSSSSGTPTSQSSSGSSATPQPSSSPGILSFTVQNMTTCKSGLISWKYSGGEEAPLLLSITNIGVPQHDAFLRIEARQNTVNSTIQQQLVDTNTSSPSWTWSTVNLTQGWYKIQGLVLSTPNVDNNSAPFFIANGTDVACLTATSPQALSTASSRASALPSSAAVKSNTGSIVGGIVGAFLAVALAIAAGLYWWSRRRKRAFVVRGGNMDRNWGSLKSTTSSIRPGGGGTQLTGNSYHVHSESTGAILQDVTGGKASVTTTPGGSDEDVIVVSEEKLVSPASSSGMSPFDVLNTPVHYDRRISAYSVQTPTSAVASEGSRSRVPSIRTSNQSLEQQAQRIRSSMETSTQRRSERLSMPTLPSPALSRLSQSPTHAQPKEEYPLTPLTPTRVNRSISTGAVSVTARRTSRKPVPQYDSSILLEDKHTDSVSTLTAGAESSQSHGTELGTGAHGTPSDLAHKSLWDRRPVHYLIPDMPPPQQD